MNRIAVLCPTRDRPEGLKRLIGSVLGTSRKADVLFYADDDQTEEYRGIPHEGGRVINWFGPRIGPAPAANLLAKKFYDYDAYGLITDDSVVTTPGWDEWVLDTIPMFPKRICVISPHHNQGEHVDMPFVTKEWIEAVGWFCCPTMYHYAWPTVTSLIGEMTAIVHAPAQKFNIDHDYVDGTYQERRIKDNTEFYEFVSLKLPPIVESVRQAMS
jgi:hypothetical protein